MLIFLLNFHSLSFSKMSSLSG